MRILKNRILVLAAAGVLFAIMTGCGGGTGSAQVQQPAVPVNSCYFNGQTLSGAAADTCCTNGIPMSTPPQSCPQQPGLSGAKAAMTGFANGALAGQSALSAANGLIGSSTGASNAGTSAATAGNSLAQGNSAAKVTPSNGQNPTMPNPNQAAAGGGSQGGGSGGGGSGSGSGGGMSLGTAVSTQAAPADPGTSAAQAAPSDASMGSYSGSGGGGRSAAGAGGQFGSLFGGDSGGAAGAHGPAELNFGRNPAGNGDSAGVTQDPEDYFGRIKPTDDIFKVVEHRYTEKAVNWARSDAYATTEAAKKLSK